ncbi:HipA N-terminal domain-containing protein [Marinobacter nauticus]|uniref:HipA N-terminal domain-containing protein n=1 Tax=Marinobacter nauticus TaxID=2743 RepID=UPI000F1B03B5|nr:HipA N-terminal domain-containing protein [Marinobacter nauticus]RKR70989.1 HipA-like protein [Marinobacter nauticus]
MTNKRPTEKELLEGLDKHTSHADELAKPLAHELTPLERLKGSVERYERPMEPVWDEWFDSEDPATDDFMAEETSFMRRTSTKAAVYMDGSLAGYLERFGSRVRFQYDKQYLLFGRRLSLSLPLQSEPFESEGLPAYFSGLCSEGWLRRIQAFEQRIDPDDLFTLLINNGLDLAGAVTIEPID